MSKYIDAEKIPYHVQKEGSVKREIAFKSDIDDIPTADVRPERHGHWIEEGDIQICSECGEEHSWQDYRASYCEDCGAKMDGKEQI